MRLRELPSRGADRSSPKPTFQNNRDALAYRQNLPAPSTGEVISQVIINAAGDEEVRTTSAPGVYFLDEPAFSPDYRYALVESARLSAPRRITSRTRSPKTPRWPSTTYPARRW